MRLPSARSILFGVALLILALAGYCLNRGVLIGYRIEAARLSDDYPVLQRCATGLDKF
jgi:hypothetical protein